MINRHLTLALHGALIILALVVAAFCFGWFRPIWHHSDSYPSIAALVYFVVVPLVTVATHKMGPRFKAFSGREKIFLATSLCLSWGLWVTGSAWLALFYIALKMEWIACPSLTTEGMPTRGSSLRPTSRRYAMAFPRCKGYSPAVGRA